MTSNGHWLDQAEASHRSGRQRPRLELILGKAVRGGAVDDDPVPPGDARQPSGEVDRGPEHVAQPGHHRSRGEPHADVGHPLVASDHGGLVSTLKFTGGKKK